jgi:uncharacterized iron-regulated membrane protein
LSTSLWRQWHKVLGLLLGVLLLLIAFSGVVLVFKENIIELNLSDVISDSENASKYSVDRLSTGLQQLLQNHSIENVYYIKTPTQGRDYWWLATRSDEIFLYDVNGEPVADRWLVLPVLYWLGELHTELLLHDGGSVLLTVLGFGCLILMIAGFISWWPGRSGFRISHLWAWSSRRGAALRQHRAVAIICLPLLLLSVITGAGMSVQSAIGFFIETKSVNGPEVKVASAAEGAPVLKLGQIDALLQSAQREAPNSQITMLSLPTAANPVLRLRLRAEDEWHVNGKTNMIIDISSGEVKIKDVKDASTGRKILNTFYPLHSSYGLPGLYKTMVMITGVLTSLLALLGWLAWMRRRGGILN